MIYLSEWQHPTSQYFLASTDNGVCYFGNQEKAVVVKWLDRHIGEGIVTGQEADDRNSRYLTDMKRYFSGDQTAFDWTYDFYGTPFQRKVWQQLLNLPYGETVTYGDIAEQIDQKTAVRAVGGAVGRNPVMIAVPCHRIIGKNGRLTGFSGGLSVKRHLLDLEGVTYRD